jgi:Winged helix DNA-binding domain
VSEATHRARGQWLHAPGGDVLHHLLAVQAQEVKTPARALGVRGGAVTGDMRITWLMRMTLHLVHARDVEWLHPLFAPRMEATNVRRLQQLGVTGADRAVELIAERVPATRAELKEHLAGHGVVVEGQAIVHLLARAAMQGRVVLDTERVFVPFSPPGDFDREAALEMLARRYGACHFGATQDDLAYWSGLPKRDCIEPGPCPVDDGPVPRVELPAFDELLLGWRDRSPTVPPELAKQVHPGGGIIRAVTLVDGVVTS